MKKKVTTISVDGQTTTENTISIGFPSSTTQAKEGLIDKEAFLMENTKVNVTDKIEERPVAGKQDNKPSK